MRLLHRMIDDSAARRPEAPAVLCGETTLTYGELARRSHGLARVLLETGSRRGDRVAVLLAKGLEVPVAFYGVLAAGAALVPIDPKSPLSQVVRILRATGATHLVSEPRRRATVEQAAAACPRLQRVIGLAPSDDLQVANVPWSDVEEAASDRPPAVSLNELDTSYILHTSGSTGVPKLIRHTHSTAMSFVDWAAEEYGLTAEDRLSNHSSHHTCFATFDYYAAARAGAATVILTPDVLMMPGSLATRLEQARVSVWYSVPTALVQLSLRGDLESRDLSAVRWVLFAGETFPDKHLRRVMKQLPHARFSHVYGSTEVNVCAYHHLPQTSEPASPLPIGRACANSRALVVDEALRPVAEGATGELLIRGSTVMSGYWNDPERNAEVLVRLPADGELEEIWFRTGDRVQTLADGNLAFVARTDLQVKVRGHRVELEEVESALLTLDGVEEAAAFAVPDREGSSSIRAVVVADSSEAAIEMRILAGVREILPLHAIPAEVTVVAALPRTPTGKVDRNALRAQQMDEERVDGE